LTTGSVTSHVKPQRMCLENTCFSLEYAFALLF